MKTNFYAHSLTVILFVIFSLAFCSCGQKNLDDSIEGLTIDPSIKFEVEKNISTLNFAAGQSEFLIYNNRLYVNGYENDELIASSMDENVS